MLQVNQNADDFSKKKKISQLQHSTIYICASLFFKHRLFYPFDYKVKISILQYNVLPVCFKKIIIKFLEFEKASKHALAGAQ